MQFLKRARAVTCSLSVSLENFLVWQLHDTVLLELLKMLETWLLMSWSATPKTGRALSDVTWLWQGMFTQLFLMCIWYRKHASWKGTINCCWCACETGNPYLWRVKNLNEELSSDPRWPFQPKPIQIWMFRIKVGQQFPALMMWGSIGQLHIFHWACWHNFSGNSGR